MADLDRCKSGKPEDGGEYNCQNGEYRLCHKASGTKYYEDVQMDFAVPLSVTGSDFTPVQFFMCCLLVNFSVLLLTTSVRKNSTWTCFKVCREHF